MTAEALRVALVHPHSWPEVRRGGERYLADLAWYLGRAGHRVDVLTGTDLQPSTSTQDKVTIRKLRHRAPGRLRRRGLTKEETFGAVVLPELARRRWDVVHAFTPSAALAARFAGLPTVYTVLGHPHPRITRQRPWLSRLFREAVRRSTVTVALSRASADATQMVFGRRAEVLPPGVRLDQFPPELAPRTGPPRILFSAHCGDRRKRADLAMAAFAELLRRRPDARLQLSGAGDHRWALETLGEEAHQVIPAIDALGTGDIDAVPARYRAATVTVLPAEEEAFGLAIVESLASGTPAVCCDLAGPPELVDSALVGRVARPDDVPALAAALDEAIDLAAHPDTPGRCAEHARRWDWCGAVGPQHEAVYRSIARRRSTRTAGP